MFTNTSGVDLPLFIAILTILLLFGCVYAWVVYWLGERKTGYVALFVVLGVFVTLGLEAVIDGKAALLSLVCFTASGTPMVVGEIVQQIRARERAIRAHQERAENAIREMDRDE